MIWVLIIGLLWAALALPVAIAIGRGLRIANAVVCAGARVDGSWTDEVTQYLRERAVPQDSPDQAITPA